MSASEQIVPPTLHDTCAVEVLSLEDVSVTKPLTTPVSVAELSVRSGNVCRGSVTQTETRMVVVRVAAAWRRVSSSVLAERGKCLFRPGQQRRRGPCLKQQSC
jgi:hypothetical protein